METMAVLSSGLVDRIGHGTFIHPSSGGSKALHNIVKDQSIPLGNIFASLCKYFSSQLVFLITFCRFYVKGQLNSKPAKNLSVLIVEFCPEFRQFIVMIFLFPANNNLDGSCCSKL